MTMNKITPCLWFDDAAEEAMNFYCSIFKNSKVLSISRYTEAGPGKPGSVLTASFEIEGQQVTLLNGGPAFKLTEAVSLSVLCDTQQELDDYWTKLLASGGKESQCGWLKDRFGLSWQIVPRILPQMMQDKDAQKRDRVMRALLKMVKLDIAALQRAYDGNG
jgi:predicted 3-demethylubiquinone-9 3-methyltransferase (glyoxalase superfamily)